MDLAIIFFPAVLIGVLALLCVAFLIKLVIEDWRAQKQQREQRD